MRFARPLIAVLAWLAVVAAGSVLVWVVIARVGDDVSAPMSADGAAEPTVGATGPTLGPTPDARPRPGKHKSHATARPGAGTSAAPGGQVPSSTPPGDSASPSSLAIPTPRATPSRSPKPAPAPKPSRPATSAPTVVRTTGSWRGAPGLVSVSCTGSVAKLLGATGSVGWRAEVESGGPRLVRVKFERVGGDDDEHAERRARVSMASGSRELEVSGWCQAGRPQFTARADS